MYNAESMKLTPQSHERMPPRRHSSDHRVSAENRWSEYIDRLDVVVVCVTAVTAGTAFATPMTGTDRGVADDVTAETVYFSEAGLLTNTLLLLEQLSGTGHNTARIVVTGTDTWAAVSVADLHVFC